MERKVIVIAGPTAAGKTGLSIEIAKTLGGEIVSADSRQVYRGLNLGTGKITPQEMEGIPHHLLDVADPKDTFSASDFVRLGRGAIDDILKRGKVPIIVGGTGFYIDALLGSISLPEVPADPAFRFQLSGFSLEELNAKIKKLDPEKAKTIDTKNPVRLIRAIEIARALGAVPPSAPEKIYDTLFIGLTLPQEELKTRIHTRLLGRVEEGMLEEAKSLHAKGLSFERMEELGLEYRYMARHLNGDMTQGEMLESLEKEIVQYAKRQITWLKRNKDIHWFRPEQKEEILLMCGEHVTPSVSTIS
ncbi:MAG: tRNA (adenosine(37)-N6)-dimethylallyltransferase MiaA [Patescibacteria group bacterium]